MPDDRSPFESELAARMRLEVARAEISPRRIEQQARVALVRRHRRRLLRTAAVAACLLLVTGGLLSAAAVTGGAPARPHAAASTTSVPATTLHPSPPLSLMPGLVQVAAVAYSTADDGVALVQQCWPCAARTGTYSSWVAVTRDAGASWTVRKTAMPTTTGEALSFAGPMDGWTGNGWYTHDGGLTWHKARVTNGVAVDSVSVAGGTVWADGTACGPFGCRSSVLSGRATGSSLAPLPDQPLRGAYGAGIVLAVAPSTAYLEAFGSSGEVVVETVDSGRQWQTTAAPCPSGDFAAGNVAPGPHSLWQFCEQGVSVKTPTGTVVKARANGKVSLARSDDGGRQWTTSPVTVHVGALHPWSDTTSWLWTTGQVWRTTDGGARWALAWSAESFNPPTQGASLSPLAFSASSGSAAEVACGVSTRRGTYLVVYATVDAGTTWQATTVSLPAR